MRVLYLFALFFTSNLLAAEYDSSSRLNTLFTTPQQRTQLDNLRDSGRYMGNPAAGITTAQTPVTVKMQGVLIHGKRTAIAFVNDQNTLRSVSLENNIRVDVKKIKAADYTVPVQVNNIPLKLRPGEQWNESKRQIKDSFQIKSNKAETSGLNNQNQSEIIP